LLVDSFFVPPMRTLTIADEQDLVNLAIFFGTAGVVGFLAGRRRQAQIRAQALASELRHANAELVRLNRDQAAAAQAAVRLARTEQQVQLLQQAEQELRDLLATISHELRTPIGTILTDSTNMLRTQEMNTSVRYRIEGIATEARRLNRLLADMLSLARIESGALHLTLEPVQVADAVAAAAERLKRTAPDRTAEGDSKEAGARGLPRSGKAPPTPVMARGWGWRSRAGWSKPTPAASRLKTSRRAKRRFALRSRNRSRLRGGDP